VIKHSFACCGLFFTLDDPRADPAFYLNQLNTRLKVALGFDEKHKFTAKANELLLFHMLSSNIESQELDATLKSYFDLNPSFSPEPVRFTIHDIEADELNFLPFIPHQEPEIPCAQQIPPATPNHPTYPTPSHLTSFNPTPSNPTPSMFDFSNYTSSTITLLQRTPASFINSSYTDSLNQSSNLDSQMLVARKLNFSISSLLN